MSKQKTPDADPGLLAGNVAPPAEKTVMKVSDPEAQAIAKMGAIMTGLDAGGRRRALAWVNDRFGPQAVLAQSQYHEDMEKSARGTL